MIKITKKIKNIKKILKVKKNYDFIEGINLLKKFPRANFIESIDVAINLNINPKKTEENIHGTVLLPHGSGKKIYIGVFCNKKDEKIAKKAGADLVGIKVLTDFIKTKNINCIDYIIATPDTINVVTEFGKILGPKKIMPSIKKGTITNDIYNTIKNIKYGQIYYQNDKNGIIHSSIGRINFENEKIKENLQVLLKIIIKNKPKTIKGIYIKKITISTTMGAGIIINALNIM